MSGPLSKQECRRDEKARKRYTSPIGDQWHLICEPLGAGLVRHEANVASGGHIEHVEIAAFLSSGQGPEQQELMRLIATLVDEQTVHG